MALQLDWIRAMDGEGDLEIADLPFYRTVKLGRIATAEDHAHLFYLLYGTGDVVELDGKSDPIHAANDYDTIQLTPFTAKEYLKFFCYFVHANNSNFYIFDGEEDDLLFELEDTIGSDLCNVIQPVTYLGTGDYGVMSYSAYLLHKDSIFYAEFDVHTTGYVEMKHDEVVWVDE